MAVLHMTMNDGDHTWKMDWDTQRDIDLYMQRAYDGEHFTFMSDGRRLVINPQKAAAIWITED